MYEQVIKPHTKPHSAPLTLVKASSHLVKPKPIVTMWLHLYEKGYVSYIGELAP